MITIKNTIKLAVVGTTLAAVAALTSCCASAPEPTPEVAPPTVSEPLK